MMKHTFLLPFEPIVGMAGVYQYWAKEKGAVFHYLSESSIELCVPLTEFLASAGYPEGSLDLREIAWGHHRLKGMMSIMDAPPEYKIENLKRIISEFPERDYVLVGDSSQHDPEVYSETARNFPARVRRILIHDVTCQGPEDPRYQKDFNGLPRNLWHIFRDPEEIKNAIPESGA
jgi:phosphatidate phosphatase APP1